MKRILWTGLMGLALCGQGFALELLTTYTNGAGVVLWTGGMAPVRTNLNELISAFPATSNLAAGAVQDVDALAAYTTISNDTVVLRGSSEIDIIGELIVFNGGIELEDGSNLNMLNQALTNPLDPTDATGVGDRGFNDARYAPIGMSSNIVFVAGGITNTVYLSGGSVTNWTQVSP